MKNKGFTLIELLITISIIGILAAIVLPRLFGPTEQSRSTEARTMLGAIRQAEEAFRNGPQGQFLLITDSDADGFCTDADTASDLRNSGWQRLGLGDPNILDGGGNPLSYFTYCVEAGANPPLINITATRTALGGGGEQNNTIILDENGQWSGTYTWVPENPQ